MDISNSVWQAVSAKQYRTRFNQVWSNASKDKNCRYAEDKHKCVLHVRTHEQSTVLPTSIL